ncbi:hypothetical protein L4D08_25455 [Photobacterium chitinilyticum]|uniref:hypothetical protein n=1 Tax=Photobacterium chitinilyticum TaxID=2485123 RepID=UPI003D149BDF
MSDYERLEQEKRNGWCKYKNPNNTLKERYEGAMIIITCHFERSVNANPENHIPFKDYVSSWLSANQVQFPDVRTKLCKEYPRLDHPPLEYETSYYNNKNSNIDPKSKHHTG